MADRCAEGRWLRGARRRSLPTRPVACPTMIGAVLAGGGRRRGERGSAPAALLAGRPLVSYPVAALAGVCDRIAVVCKEHTTLPKLPGTERWNESAEPRHPLTGIVHALEMAAGPVLVCAGDMPFVTADACRTLLHAASSGSAVVAARRPCSSPPLASTRRRRSRPCGRLPRTRR